MKTDVYNSQIFIMADIHHGGMERYQNDVISSEFNFFPREISIKLCLSHLRSGKILFFVFGEKYLFLKSNS